LQPIEIANQVAKILAAGSPASKTKTHKLVGRHGNDYHLLDLDDVLALQAERELVWVITDKQRYLATQSLRVLQERLESPPFERVHRNAIVNVDHVRKMTALSSQRWLVTLSNALEIVASKRQANRIRHILQW
jgi:DNA-binding LytR/AlgR family response regulator